MRTLSFLVALFIGITAAQAQKAPYKVVIDVTSGDTLVHQMVLRWLGEITGSDPNAQVEVVFYAGSLDMVTQGRSVVADQLVAYATRPNLSLKVCEQTLKRKQVSKDQLLKGVSTVQDGIYEIVQRQYEGWGYIKAAR
ncbi:MAG: DsrE family protein [Flavobacteriales bacterium]|nr:DsrE family protein [Flavobacteriales bacterium]